MSAAFIYSFLKFRNIGSVQGSFTSLPTWQIIKFPLGFSFWYIFRKNDGWSLLKCTLYWHSAKSNEESSWVSMNSSLVILITSGLVGKGSTLRQVPAFPDRWQRSINLSANFVPFDPRSTALKLWGRSSAHLLGMLSAILALTKRCPSSAYVYEYSYMVYLFLMLITSNKFIG